MKPSYLKIFSISTIVIALTLIFQNCSPVNISKPFARNSFPIKFVASQKFASESFVLDQKALDCAEVTLAGWKCLNTTVVTSEGLSYKISLSWSRPHLASRGTVLMAIGGDGKGQSRADPPSKQMMDELSDLDQVRVIQLSFDDIPNRAPGYGGYWTHAGGYKSSGAAFQAALQVIIEQRIVVGDFLNYLGGSNGGMIAAFAMAHYEADQYFDRVVFQMGPFLPDLRNACSDQSPSGFHLNTQDSIKFLSGLVNTWTFGDPNTSICAAGAEDRVSILKDGKTVYPNTHIHTIMGADEVTRGFGPWILASNLEWFNAVNGKSKSRWVRPGVAHNNMYQDMRRLLKLAPHESPAYEANCLSPSCEVKEAPTLPPLPPEKQITFSVSGVLRNGIFTQGEILQGRVEGYTENDTYGCIEIVGRSSCSDADFKKLPNEDWSYINGAWVSAIDSGRFPAYTYKSYVKDSAGETRTYLLEIRAP